MDVNFRDLKILRQRLFAGDSMRIIALENKVTTERVRQILNKFFRYYQNKQNNFLYEHFSVRTINALKGAGLFDKEKIITSFEKNPAEILSIRCIGKQSFLEIETFYRKFKKED